MIRERELMKNIRESTQTSSELTDGIDSRNQRTSPPKKISKVKGEILHFDLSVANNPKNNTDLEAEDLKTIIKKKEAIARVRALYGQASSTDAIYQSLLKAKALRFNKRIMIITPIISILDAISCYLYVNATGEVNYSVIPFITVLLSCVSLFLTAIIADITTRRDKS